MAPPSQKNPRKKIWDHEKDLYDFLLDKFKISDPTAQKKKLNDLLHKFYVNDPKADSDLIKFTDGSSSIIQSHLLHLHLQDQNSDNNNNDNEENLSEYEDERHRFLMNHMKRDGKSYVFEIVEDGVCVKFGDESSCAGSDDLVQKTNNGDESVKQEIRDNGDDLVQKTNNGDDHDDDVIDIIPVESSGYTEKDKGNYVGVHEEEDNKEFETSLPPEDNTKEDKGVYVGVNEEEDNKVDTEDDGLEDVWREMAMAIETSKV